MLTTILKFFAGGGLTAITDTIVELRRLELNAETQEKALEFNEKVRQLEAQRSILLAEQKDRLTKWVRPSFAFIALVFWAKLGIWDTVLGLGTTPYPGEHVMWFMMLIPAAYFLTRPFEKIYRK